MSDALLARVVAEAPRLPFVALLHWLERLLGAEVGAPEAEPQVTLRHDPALAFHASDVAHARMSQPDSPRVTVTTTFAGLTGVVSPLPAMLLEASAREGPSDCADGGLVELAHHRLLALLYRGLIKLDLARSGATAPALDWVLLLAGLPSEGRERTTSLPSATLLQLAPLLLMYPANAERLRVGIAALFADLLEASAVRVCVQQGGHVRITERDRPRLGVDLRLGRTSALGERCRAPSAAIALALGPLSQAACAALSPGGERADTLVALVRLLVPETIETMVALHPAQSRPAGLGRGVRLKRDSWLHGEGLPQPVRFVIA